MERHDVHSVTEKELRKAYEEDEDFKEYVDKSKFPDLNTAFQNMMVKYYYLYLLDQE